MNESNNTIIGLQVLGDRAVFDFLSFGKTDGVWPEFFDEMTSVVGIHCMLEPQNFIAFCRPGALTFWSDYTSKAPCRLPEAPRIIESTYNALLYIKPIEEALLLLTGSQPDEAAEFRRRNGCITLEHASFDILLKRIAEHKGISRDAAETVFGEWHYYARYAEMRYLQAEQRQNESI